jgi:hypothetical protein
VDNNDIMIQKTKRWSFIWLFGTVAAGYTTVFPPLSTFLYGLLQTLMLLAVKALAFFSMGVFGFLPFVLLERMGILEKSLISTSLEYLLPSYILEDIIGGWCLGFQNFMNFVITFSKNELFTFFSDCLGVRRGLEILSQEFGHVKVLKPVFEWGLEVIHFFFEN